MIDTKKFFDKIVSPINIAVGELVITDLVEEDKADYQKLYLDQENNRFWGYDYQQDLGENLPTADYFFSFMQGLKAKKEEYSFAVRKDGVLIGEMVLYNFDSQGGVEMGFRYFKEYQGKGYAIRCARVLVEYAFNVLGATKVKARCYKQNERSEKLIIKLGMKRVYEDNIHYYFEKYKEQ